MQELTDLLTEATEAIAADYFQLRIDGGVPVYRERVYCYELYHQLRLRWPRDCRFLINGEIDKIAHPILRQLGADHAKPDLLIHQPGNMTGNHAIIEVKSARAGLREIRKDIRTLSLFRREVGYARSIYLVFGDQFDRFLGRLALAVREAERLEPTELWLHSGAGRAAIHEETLER
jgi:hypothetical protein